MSVLLYQQSDSTHIQIHRLIATIIGLIYLPDFVNWKSGGKQTCGGMELEFQIAVFSCRHTRQGINIERVIVGFIKYFVAQPFQSGDIGQIGQFGGGWKTT